MISSRWSSHHDALYSIAKQSPRSRHSLLHSSRLLTPTKVFWPLPPFAVRQEPCGLNGIQETLEGHAVNADSGQPNVGLVVFPLPALTLLQLLEFAQHTLPEVDSELQAGSLFMQETWHRLAP